MESRLNSFKMPEVGITGIKVFIALVAMTILCPFSFTVLAQKNTQNKLVKISGQVKDEEGQTLPGVSVVIKGTSLLRVTNDNGEYTLTDVSRGAVLIFSFLGFQTIETVVGNNTTINIVMKTSMSTLDEVVVIGYGTARRQDVTGSVGQVNIKDLQKAPVLSFDQALAGRLAGVEVSSADGQPGEEGTNIVIRGANSLTQDNSPLYVVDGFPMESPDNAAINPDDIESITVLKDASATAIYGARGANGVIVIETKKGKSGNTTVTYSASLGSQQVTKKMELLNPYEFIKYQLEIYPTATPTRYFTDGKTLESYKDIKGIDWQDEILRDGFNQLHNLAIRGGNEKTKFSVSGSFNDMNGVILNSGQSRYQGRFVLDHTLSKKVQVGLNFNYSVTQAFGSIVSSGGSAASRYLYSVWGYRPVTPALLDGEEDPDLYEEIVDDMVSSAADTRINPILSAENELRKRRNGNLTANAFASYAITPALTLKVSGGYTSLLRRNQTFNNSFTPSGTPKLARNIRGINGAVSYTESSTWLNENTLTWKKNFNKSNRLEVLGGFTMQGSYREGYGYNSQLISNEVLGMSGLDTGTPYNSSASYSDNALASFLGRANYNLNSKYLFTASFRADGSSKFPADNRWGYFPSAAFAWRLKNENFVRKVKAISDAKLRVSYGLTGNNRVSDFAPIPALGQSYSYYYSFNNSTPNPGITPNNMGNSKLKWETTAQADIGLDLSFIKNRIELSADVYRKVTRDLLLNADMPYATGFASIYRNIGKIRNQGLEITLNTINIDKQKFKWQSSFNISFNQNKILALVEDQNNRLSAMNWENAWDNTPLYIAEVGAPAAMFYGYIWDGVYQYSDFVNGVLKPELPYHGTDRAAIKPGDIKYRDLDGDGVITAADQTVIGRTLPVHNGGFSNNFVYKGLSLGVFLQWKYGNQIYNANRIIFEGNTLSRANFNQFSTFAGRWSPENQSNVIPSAEGRGPTGYYSTRHIEDGSFLRLKTIELSYALPIKWVSRIKLSGLSFNVSAQNLYTWNSYSGMDPEVAVANTTLTPGFDYSAYPRARTLVFGLKANF